MERFRNLHLIPGISGCGKTSIARYLADKLPAAAVSVGYTTRPPRPDERNGIDYNFRNQRHHTTVMRRSGWKSSQIGDYYYYARDEDTIPDEQISTRILPVAYSALAEVLRDYSPMMDNQPITVIPIVINPEIQDEWLHRLQPLRPNRNLENELLEQDAILETVKFDAIYFPSWNLGSDCKNYLNLYKAIITSKRSII